MKITGKDLLFTTAIFGALVSSNIVAQSLYTKHQIGVDKKRLMLVGIGGVAATLMLYKILIKKSS